MEIVERVGAIAIKHRLPLVVARGTERGLGDFSLVGCRGAAHVQVQTTLFILDLIITIAGRDEGPDGVGTAAERILNDGRVIRRRGAFHIGRQTAGDALNLVLARK
jgi:hypothetical protein